MNNEIVKNLNKKAKTRLWTAKISGLLCSIGLVAVLFCFYFRIINEWVLCMAVSSMSGVNFCINATLFELRESSISARINLFLSGIMFLAGIIFCIYGLVSGNLYI